MKAILRNYRQSPRKARMVANFIRGKKVDRALSELNLLAKRGAAPLAKLLRSALANAKANSAVASDNLVVKEIRVSPGFMFKRYMPRAFGRAAPVRKRTSHISIILEERKNK